MTNMAGVDTPEGRVDAITAAAGEQAQDQLTAFLTKENAESARYVTVETHKLINSLVHQSLLNSKFQFERGDNL